MNRLNHKVAVVTGGAKGIGAAACRCMAQEGAKVAVTDLAEREGKAIAGEIQSSGGTARFWRLDVTKSDEIRRVLDDVAAEFGKIDVLVNNAGIAGPNKPTHEINEEEWDKLMDVNVKGVYLCTRHAIPHLKKNGGGCIINLSSIYGIIGAADLPPYHASKGAVRLMTKNDALLYAADNIRVNSIHPGYIWTPLVEDLARKSADGVAAFRKQLDARHPIGNVGEPEDIGWGVVYLASEEAKFITGSELVIDGGYTAQ